VEYLKALLESLDMVFRKEEIHGEEVEPEKKEGWVSYYEEDG